MGAKVGGNKGGPMADINVTPLVDVVLVLLIIFMVITPMLSSGIDVKLPASTTATSTQDVGQHLVVGIKEDGTPYVDTTPSSLETLVDDLNRELRKDPSKSLLIKAHADLDYGSFRAVTDVMAKNGVPMVLIAADKPADVPSEGE
ncbi:MAG: biopolymer transporter ExbD [Pseudomonadota bacterium]